MFLKGTINQKFRTSRFVDVLSISLVEETQEVGVIENLPRVFSRYLTQEVDDF